MAITETIQKRRLVTVLGENEAPASFYFEGVRIFERDDGTDPPAPQPVQIPATADEVAKFFGDAAPHHVAAVEQMAKRVQQVHDDHEKKHATTIERAAKAIEALRSGVEAADAALKAID